MTVIVLDVHRAASQRIGSRYQVAALARRSLRPDVDRYQPERSPWAHGFAPGADARLGPPETAARVLGFPAAAFIPRGPNDTDPVPGTGGMVCIPMMRTNNPATTKRWSPIVFAAPIPYPVHLTHLHLSAITDVKNTQTFTLRISALNLIWIANQSTLFIPMATAPADIALDCDLRVPALLEAELRDDFDPASRMGLRGNIVLAYRHLAPGEQ